MLQSLEASLKRLNTDYVDIYWLHMWDAMTPVVDLIYSGIFEQIDDHHTEV
jgi:aryl-alcohol dehydrogenase-like predicted oxidoreductase